MEPQASSCSLMLGSPTQEFRPLCGAVRRRARRLRHDDARLWESCGLMCAAQRMSRLFRGCT
jgi:hypothetical protein